ncbi:AgmX/PglI C-terminal domain-containing protein [Catenovulum sediminis]|uniref:AgmX/PglI C-terminal domain-containing protein n=1 Tax=Catenovulum sediminis TaxID=1740262 RepID=UPI00117CDBD1|nr:AgmX/PglI C-terminal domain-containing protein [Catenovulum sediminis]
MTSAAFGTQWDERQAWGESSKQDKFFTKICLFLLLVYLCFALIVPFIETAELTREAKQSLPPQLAKIVLQKKQLEQPEPEPEPVPTEVEKTKPEPPTASEKRQAAKQKARSTGLAAMKNELFAMRQAVDIKPIQKEKLKESKSEAQVIERNKLQAVTDRKSRQVNKAQSAKIEEANTAELGERTIKQIRLAEQEQIGSDNYLANRSDNTGNATDSEDAANIQDAQGQRSEASIRQVLENNKTSLYTLYSKALRKNPLLAGKVVFELEIAASGEIVKAAILSSELNDKKLERRLLLKLKSIQFAAQQVASINTQWTIEFLPG